MNIKWKSCKECTYRVDGLHGITLCTIATLPLSSRKNCKLKEIGDPLLERIKKLESDNK